MVRHAAVVGIGRTAYTRPSGRSVLAQAAEAARAAIADAGLVPQDVDGVSSFQAADSVLGYELADAIGIDDLRWRSASSAMASRAGREAPGTSGRT